MMKKRISMTVVAAALSVSSSVMAQYRVGDDGRALDANNRIGSGGFNDRKDLPPGVASPNQIVTGNVGGNKHFRGSIHYGDPRDFRGVTATENTDRFLRRTEGVDYRSRTTGAPPPVFYGNRTISPPQQGLQQEFGTGVYVPAPAQSRLRGDVRLGIPMEGPSISLPQPGELVMPGPVDPSKNQQMLLTASPLYGIRQLNVKDQNDQQFLTRYTNIGTMGQKSGSLTSDELAKAQAELLEGISDVNQADSAAVAGSNLAGTELTAKTPEGALSGTIKPADAGVRQRLLLPPEKQSALLADLKNRRKQIDEKGLKDAEAARLYNAEMQARRDAEKASREQDRQTMAAPRERPKPPEQPTVVAPLPRPEERPAPIKITSLAEGVKAKALHDLLVTAESRVKEGKFSSALDAYDNAEQVAPNNPLIVLGRAHAELGASYYGRAEGDLRTAVQAEPALLLAQYDLQNLFGEQRLQFLIRDLRDIVQREQKQPRPLLLLAYISYNTGNESRALVYLNQASQLSPDDPFIDLLRRNWNLPAEEK